MDARLLQTLNFNYFVFFLFRFIFHAATQIGYTFYMLASDGAGHEGVHKKVLGPTVEVHEAHRQVSINQGPIFFLFISFKIDCK